MKHLDHMQPDRAGHAAGAGRARRCFGSSWMPARKVWVARVFRALGRAVATVLCVFAILFSAPPAMADSGAQFWVQPSMLSLEEAADRVQGTYGGRVVAAQAVRAGGHEGFRIRVLLDDGRVITVFVDADSGAMRPMG